MVFSFFKKKNNAAEEKMPERPAARPRPAPTPTLDLSSPSKAEKPASPPNAPPPASEKPLATGSLSPLAQRGLTPQSREDECEDDFADSGIFLASIDPGFDAYQADIEQVVVLFANGQDTAARTLLDTLVQSYRGEQALRFWNMYFDFLQLKGNRTEFERLGLRFAESCETSPPPWQEGYNTQVSIIADLHTVDLHGVLTEDDTKLLTPVLAAMERKLPIQLLCNRLQGCDDAIAGQLATILKLAREKNVPLTLVGGERLMATLKTRTAGAKRQHLGSWHLCFEVLQRLGEQAEFEERAVDFAIAFEQSPPSWLPMTASPCGTAAPVRSHDAYYLSGEIANTRFDELKEIFKAHRYPVLDFSGVRRIDFFSVGQLANRLGVAKESGRDIVIRSPNHLVAELMGVVGIQKYARILVKKT